MQMSGMPVQSRCRLGGRINIIQRMFGLCKKSESNQMTLEDAKRLLYQYRYAIVDNANDKIHSLFENYDSANEMMKSIIRFNYYINYRIVDLCSI